MFRENDKHTQPALISAIHDLPERQRKRLEQSWAGTFYCEFFSRIDESAFSGLYSEKPSRPNIPVNVLVGLEAMKAGFGWSDEELYENFLYHLQVRYALGYDRLGEGKFEIRTLYYFRQRLGLYNLEKGVNLLEKAFENITDKQLLDLKVRSGMQRMDSTQIASNIMDASRLHLLVEGVQRLHRIASEAEKAQLAGQFEPYLKDSAGHYAYRVKGKEATRAHTQKVGQDLYTILQALQANHAQEARYQVVKRLLEENFHLVEQGVQAKENNELPAGSLQSFDDLEATYRTKGNAHYQGYVANLTETCDPQNPLQLITKVQVDSNNTEDAQLLNEALPNLKERTHLHPIITDGAYPSDKNDEDLRAEGLQIIQTGIRGAKPDPERFNLADFQISQNDTGQPVSVTRPAGQTAAVSSGRTTGFFVRFAPEICAVCPFQLNQQCRARPQKRDKRYFIAFTHQQIHVAQRRRDYFAHKQAEHNLRSAVEASVRSLKHPFPAGKLPVRGKFRVTCLVIASAAMTNVRRIQRYLETQRKALIEGQTAKSRQNLGKPLPETMLDSFFASLRTCLAPWPQPRLAFQTGFGCGKMASCSGVTVKSKLKFSCPNPAYLLQRKGAGTQQERFRAGAINHRGGRTARSRTAIQNQRNPISQLSHDLLRRTGTGPSRKIGRGHGQRTGGAQ